jgi:uncharacterized protein YjbI with pentapeptide repeats
LYSTNMSGADLSYSDFTFAKMDRRDMYGARNIPLRLPWSWKYE